MARSIIVPPRPGPASVEPSDDETSRQIRIEKHLDALGHAMDGMFEIPGTKWRFGLDSLIGLVPNVGDALTSVVSFYILHAGARYGVPKITLLRMAFNIGLDYIVGIIPILGDAFDFVWKANDKNLRLIRARGRGRNTGTTGDYAFVYGVVAGLILLLLGCIGLSVYLLAILFRELGQALGIG